MSLFRLQEWWSTSFPSEEFDSNCCVVGDLMGLSNESGASASNNNSINDDSLETSADMMNSSADSNSDNNSTEPTANYQTQIIIGSIQGVLRVFLPSSRNYNIQHLIIEGE